MTNLKNLIEGLETYEKVLLALAGVLAAAVILYKKLVEVWSEVQ